MILPLVQRQLMAVYDVDAPDVREFLVDEAEARSLAGERRAAREWVFVRESGEDVDIGVYVHQDVVARTDGLRPREAASSSLAAFATLVEAVSHFLLLVRRATHGEPVSLLELEAQAEVDKFVSVRLLLGAQPDLRRRLFRNAVLADDLHADERERYVEAGRLADAFCAELERLPHVDAMLGELRRFYRQPGAARMARLRRRVRPG